VHYDQQPLHIRQTVFNNVHIDSISALTEYHAFFDKKFPGFFQFLYDAIYYSKSSATTEFYIENCTTDILSFHYCYETFYELFNLHFNHELRYERFRNLFTVAPKDKIKITPNWIERTVNKYDLKEKLIQHTPNSYCDFQLR